MCKQIQRSLSLIYFQLFIFTASHLSSVHIVAQIARPTGRSGRHLQQLGPPAHRGLKLLKEHVPRLGRTGEAASTRRAMLRAQEEAK